MRELTPIECSKAAPSRLNPVCIGVYIRTPTLLDGWHQPSSSTPSHSTSLDSSSNTCSSSFNELTTDMNSLKTVPVTLEDRTGAITNTDFDDMYDRVFLHVARVPGHSTTKIFEMQVRASRHRNAQAVQRATPTVSLDFMPDESLGTITFSKYRMSVPMSQYLRKLSFFGPSLCRKFVASDGREYKWSYRALDDHEWTVSLFRYIDKC
ncbi:hypothetical protein CC2G_011131 [Coprinopsis cinerea AmutBmut pab1-1]|nr:hypothetical protein CC2G_011131 [Coprinopsis cinerea AmutBmut pab1-1]